MSRNIPHDEPLSDEDRAYLAMRGEDARIRMMDQRFPAQPEAEAAQEDETKDEETEAPDYSAMTVTALKAEISKRNQDREPQDQMRVSGTNDELIARLQADDEAADEDDDEEDDEDDE